MKVTAFAVVCSDDFHVTLLSLAIVTPKSYGMERFLYYKKDRNQLQFDNLDDTAKYIMKSLESYGYEIEKEYDNMVCYTSLNFMDISKSFNFEFYLQFLEM